MSREELLTLLAETSKPVLTDGAMGTMLHGAVWPSTRASMH